MKVFSYLEILTVANLVFSTGSIKSYPTERFFALTR